MLKSNLIKSTYRGRDDVFEIVHHMLNRRMVTDDEKQTNFSPLIESIIDGENGDVETAPSVYFHMYVKNNTGYLYRLIQVIF
jgi:hypothetical protein